MTVPYYTIQSYKLLLSVRSPSSSSVRMRWLRSRRRQRRRSSRANASNRSKCHVRRIRRSRVSRAQSRWRSVLSTPLHSAKALRSTAHEEEEVSAARSLLLLEQPATGSAREEALASATVGAKSESRAAPIAASSRDARRVRARPSHRLGAR